MNKLPWNIIGNGAIGSFCAANIHQQQSPYCLITRRPNNQIEFSENGGQIRLNPSLTLDQVSSISNLLIPTKAYDVVPVVKQVREHLASGANVVLCHNGMGTLDEALEHLPDTANLYFCTTSNGAFKSDNKIVLAGLGDTYWQAIKTPSLDTSLGNQDFELLFRTSEMANDLPSLMWRKLVINCVINPLTALLNVKNGVLAAEKYQPFIRELISETVEVANTQGVSLPLKDTNDLVANVIQGTASNTSSMLQDAMAGRQTEVDFINGYVVKQAAKDNQSAPLNALLWESVNELSRSPLSQQALDRLFQR